MTPSDPRDIRSELREIAHAITADASPGHDAVGGSVSSLTEALMGITAALQTGLSDVATALEGLDRAAAPPDRCSDPPPPPWWNASMDRDG